MVEKKTGHTQGIDLPPKKGLKKRGGPFLTPAMVFLGRGFCLLFWTLEPTEPHRTLTKGSKTLTPYTTEKNDASQSGED